MSRRAALAKPSQPNVRALVAEELDAALERLGAEIPTADAALILRLCIAYFAEIHARSLGHTSTVKALIAIARRGVRFAEVELTALRN